MILACYDGAADAQAAIDLATLSPGAEATVQASWGTMTRTSPPSLGLGRVGPDGDDDVAATIKHAALDTASDGVPRANSAGLVVHPPIATRDWTPLPAILAAAVR